MYHFLSFIFSFCSLSYQMIISAKVIEVSGGGLFLYPFSLLLFIFFMGYAVKKAEKSDLNTLVLNEYILIFLASVFPVILSVLETFSLSFVLFYLLLSSALFGYFTGKELPILFKYASEKNVLILDYVASLVATLVFNFYLFPVFGLFKSIYFVALLNALSLLFFKRFIFVVSLILLVSSNFLENRMIRMKYNLKEEDLVIKQQTLYQSIVLTKSKNNVKAYLNNNLQFSLNDDETDFYHFHLVHPFLDLFSFRNILILGGGDGLPAKEVLKYETDNIDMVDLDEQWVEFSQNNALMKKVSNDSLNSKRINIHIEDAFQYMRHNNKRYDFIVVDFPEADNLAGMRIHSLEFAKDIKSSLKELGVVVIQNDSYSYPGTEQIIFNTLAKAGLYPLKASRFRSSKRDEVITQFVAFKNAKLRDSFLSQYEDYIKQKKYAPLSYKVLPLGDIVNTKFNPILLRKRLEYLLWN